MINELINYIVWDPEAVICKLGPVVIRWYSTFWMIGLVGVYLIVKHLYKVMGKTEEQFEPLFMYAFISIILGARLGHCLLYEPGYFLSSGTHIIEMFLPIRYGLDGSWHFTGYEGLASHGGTIGIIIGVLLYCRKTKLEKLWVLDTCSIAVPFIACCIRLGNLMNSEIIGKVTDVPWAFIFARIDQYPRHPGQLYEALAYACFFPILWYFWKKRPQLVGTGFFLGLDILLIFTFRFFIEYTKEIQEAFEAGLPIDMGQILSIPFIALGAYFTYTGWNKIKTN